tara:strand:+ start:412 stop:642 length:231 start_codon:yes stop_codon:yes gene_type:complete
VKCWHCHKELIWGGDHDIEKKNEDYDMVTHLSCPKCHSHVDVYHPSVKLLKEYKDYDKDKERIKKISRDYIRKKKK